MKPYLTIGMLVISNIFMTFAWYGQLHLRGQRWFDTLPQLLVIVFCWSIAFFEYIFLVPANRIGFQGNGGPFTLFQLKIIQEVVSLTVFTVFALTFFKTETDVYKRQPEPGSRLFSVRAGSKRSAEIRFRAVRFRLPKRR